MCFIAQITKFLESIFGSGRLSRNNNFDVCCPICKHSDVNKKKLSFLLPSTKCHCWVCDYKAYSCLPLIKKFGTKEQLQYYLDNFHKNDIKDDSNLHINELVKLPDDFKLFALNTTTKNPFIKAKFNYLFHRGITLNDLWYYKIGYSEFDYRWNDKVLFPSFDKNGNLNFFVGRTISGSRFNRYDNPNVSKNDFIFNEVNINFKQSIILCEGIFDSIKCGENSIPLMGSNFNENSLLFNEIVAHNSNVILALDADVFYTKTFKICKKLQEYDINVKIVDTRNITDPGTVTKDVMQELIKNAINPTWDNLILTKLSKIKVSLNI